jgi:preprotein translocase subunit SecF
VSITEVFDPTFDADQHVAMIRIQAQEGQESVSPETVAAVEEALQDRLSGHDLPLGRKRRAEGVGRVDHHGADRRGRSLAAILVYIWLRFEWQFSVGAVAALIHDVVLTIGVFSLLQIRFDLATIAALLTIIGYSINDTVVIFDRLRENLIKYKQRALRDVMNLSANETLSRTLMTSGTTLLALIALLSWAAT